LDISIRNHPGRETQITVTEASYVDWEYPKDAFDLAVSNQTMHHFLPGKKTEIYRKILGALKPGGSYIEGDFIVDDSLAEQYKARYKRLTANLPKTADSGAYHIDIPLTVETQKKLLQDAGFGSVEVLADATKAEWSYAVLRATKTEESRSGQIRQVRLA
jgi:tRNA (cmo5U34)-methyltransferase